MPNWTPGPYARLGQSAQIVNAAGRTIGHADSQFQDAQQAAATTDLFAAAPDLYEALEAITKTSGVSDELYAPHNGDLYRRVDAALANATGEKPKGGPHAR